MQNSLHSNGSKGSNGHTAHAAPPRDLLGEHLQAADLHIKQGDLQACRVSMENAAQVAPTNVKILSTLGNLCFQMGDFYGARVNYERVLQIEPQDAVLQVQLATSCQRLD
jgi:Flp pilus assembly protein TadD